MESSQLCLQRVLEHCSDDLRCRPIVDEIMESAYDLAHDQYGNYVTQVCLLFNPRPQERFFVPYPFVPYFLYPSFDIKFKKLVYCYSMSWRGENHLSGVESSINCVGELYH